MIIYISLTNKPYHQVPKVVSFFSAKNIVRNNSLPRRFSQFFLCFFEFK